MVRTVILDIDGTLVDTNYLHVEAWARALRAVGLVVPRSAIHAQMGKGADQFLPTFIHDPEQAEQANELHSRIYRELQPHAYPLPGAHELLVSLQERNYTTWLASSAKPDELQFLLRLLDAEGLLSGVISAGDVKSSKPSPDVFEQALVRAQTPADEAVAVGDTVWDVQAAMRLDLRCVCLLTGGTGREELERSGAVAVFKDCADLLAHRFPEGF